MSMHKLNITLNTNTLLDSISRSLNFNENESKDKYIHIIKSIIKEEFTEYEIELNHGNKNNVTVKLNGELALNSDFIQSIEEEVLYVLEKIEKDIYSNKFNLWLVEN